MLFTALGHNSRSIAQSNPRKPSNEARSSVGCS